MKRRTHEKGVLGALGAALVALGCGSIAESGPTAVERQPTPSGPTIGPDFPIVDPVVAARTNVPIVAAELGQGTYLLVFHIARGIAEHQLVGVRVRASDGSILDPLGIPIATALVASSFIAVKVVYAVDHWLIVYQGDQTQFFSVTVANNATVGTPAPLVGISLGVPRGFAWGTDRALLTTGSGMGLFVSGAGAAMGSPFTISSVTPGPGQDAGNVAFNGSSFLASFYTLAPPRVRVTSVTNAGPTGMSADAYFTTRSACSTSSATVATDGTNFLVRYTASPPSCAAGGASNPLTEYYRTASVAGDGSVTLGTASTLTQALAPVYTNGNYLLHNAPSALRVDSTGAPIGTIQPLLAGVLNEFVSAGQASSGVGLVPERGTTDLLAVSGPLAMRVATNLAPIDNPPLAPFKLPKPQGAVATTFDGTNYVAVWNDSGRGGVRAARVTPNGTVLEPASIGLANATAFSSTFAASNGSGSLLGWFDNGALTMSRLSTTGTPTSVDVSALAVSDVFSASLASNASDYVFAWSNNSLIRAGKISATGSATAPVTVSPYPNRLSMAYDGMSYVVVQAVGYGNYRDLIATRVTPGLGVLDSPPKVLSTFPTSNDGVGPLIASDGTQSLVVWFEVASDESTTLRAARINRNLDVLDSPPVTIAVRPGWLMEASMAWDGARYWVLFEDAPSSSRATQVPLYGSRIGANAVPIDSAPFLVSGSLPYGVGIPGRQSYLAHGEPNRLFLANIEDEPSRDSQAVRGRFLSSPVGGLGGAGGVGGAGAGGAGAGGAGAGGAGAGGAGAGGAGAGAGGGGVGGLGGSGPVGGAGMTGGGVGGAGTGGAGTGGVGGEGGDGAAGDGSAGDGSAGDGSAGEGSAGEAGAAGEGPEGGTSSTGGRGGASATGGRAAGGSGGASTGGSHHGGSGDDDDSGCSCTVPGSRRNEGSLWLTGAFAALALTRRRRVPRLAS